MSVLYSSPTAYANGVFSPDISSGVLRCSCRVRFQKDPVESQCMCSAATKTWSKLISAVGDTTELISMSCMVRALRIACLSMPVTCATYVCFAWCVVHVKYPKSAEWKPKNISRPHSWKQIDRPSRIFFWSLHLRAIWRIFSGSLPTS